MASVQVNDVGVALELVISNQSNDNALDVSAATTKQIILKPPRGGAAITKTAVLSGAGTDGKIRYVTEAGVLSTAGTWRIQGFVVLGAVEVRTEVASFPVRPNL